MDSNEKFVRDLIASTVYLPYPFILTDTVTKSVSKKIFGRTPDAIVYIFTCIDRIVADGASGPGVYTFEPGQTFYASYILSNYYYILPSFRDLDR